MILDRLADLATAKVLALFLVAIGVVELLLRPAVGAEWQWAVNLAGLGLAIGLLVIGSAPLVQSRLRARRQE